MKLTQRLHTVDDAPPRYALIVHNHYSDIQTLEHFYLDPIGTSCLIFSVDYDKPKAVSAAYGKATARAILEECTVQGIDTIFCCDSRYWKYLSKIQVMTKALGKVVPCSLDNDISVVGCPSFAAIEYDPTNEAKILYGISTLKKHLKLDETADTEFSIHKASEEEVPTWLNRLLTYPQITVDVETLSLKHYAANPQTIAFAWSATEAVVFRMYKKSVREQLKAFFEEYQGDIICHNAYFDLKVLIYTLWMTHLEDFRGLKKGIDVFKHKTYDTLVINKVLLNSTSSPDLSLKALTIAYMGNYAEDVTDITKLSLDNLLTYNAKDAIATFWLFTTSYPKLQDKLLHFYNSLGLPSVFLCIRISLTGMPISISRVDQLHKHLSSASTALIARLRTYPEVVKATHLLQKRRWKKHCAKLKASIPNIANSYEPFNPNSGDQLCVLFYEILGFNIPHYTDEGNPSTDKKAVAALKELHPKYSHLFDTIQDIADISTILSTFIPAFKRYSKKTRSGYRLYGEFSSTGTQSYRLASNSPNLMNLPSGSKYGKAVKALFVAHEGKKFGGADFQALEAKIDAILTGDPNKEKVYTQGYDSHCLNCYNYWPEKFPDIDPDSVDSINSIEEKYPNERRESKGPTFALTYLGSEYTLENRAGFSKPEAKRVYDNYWTLYAVTKEHIQYITDHAINHGYVPLAFGAQLKTPTLHGKPVNFGLSNYEQAELRSAYNATSQSYGLLLNRALIELYDRLDTAPQEIQDQIEIVNQIHDAGYVHYDDNPEAEKWVAKNLTESMEWQEDPIIANEEIKLTADFESGPSWAELKKLEG